MHVYALLVWLQLGRNRVYKMHVYALLVWLQLGRNRVRVRAGVRIDMFRSNMFSSKCSRS